MPEEKGKETIEFKYTVADDYQVIYANGIFGGPNPSGEIRFDFWYEYRTFPEKIEFEVLKDKLGEEISRTPQRPEIIRERRVGIIMLPHHAKDIGNFLIEKSEQFLEREGKGG